jgi:putative membrane protein
MMSGDWGGGWMGFGGGLAMLLFWGLAIFLLVVLVRWAVSRTDKPEPPGAAGALEILQRRYANGEIDEPTYQRMKAELEARS